MNEFALANDTYVSFITEQKCTLGVPSRTTIELPLMSVSLGRAYVEVLVANDQSKRVLHVQSISCWAPSCIGPYNQVEVCHVLFNVVVQFTASIEHTHTSPASSTEQPSCPVCLERLDQEMGGILTTICNHSFHCSCISKWTDFSCPKGILVCFVILDDP